MLRALAMARTLDVSFHVVRIPAGKDPADWVAAGNGAGEFDSLAAHAHTLLQFHVRSVLSAHDLAKADERTRALTLLKGVLAEASSPIERDEEVRYVADSLRLSPESVRHLLSGLPAGGRAGQGARGASAATTRLLSSERVLEARFLAACLAVPEAGAKSLAAVDERQFADPDMRRASMAVRARLERLRVEDGGESVEEEEKEQTSDDGLADDALAEVMVRAAGERFDENVLVELFLRMQEAELGRRIARLRRRLREDGGSVGAGVEAETAAAQSDGSKGDAAETDPPEGDESTLLQLEARRRRVREQIRKVPLEERGKPE